MNNITKTCNKCSEVKFLQDFCKNKTCTFGVSGTCKACAKISRRNHYLENKDKVLMQSKEYYYSNKTRILKRMEQYYIDNSSEIIKRTTKYQTTRRKYDNIYKFKTDIRALIRDSFKRTKHLKKSKTSDILGCSLEYFKQYLEKQFQPGMTWDNHGINGWHIDHIIPISRATTEEDIIKLNHYTNLQPLWSKDNIRKSNKII